MAHLPALLDSDTLSEVMKGHDPQVLHNAQDYLREHRVFQKELGPAFDIRAFHDEVLRHGALPLALLEQNVKAWTASRSVSK